MVYWVFGYGSLIFKPPPHAVEQKSGYVKGVVRRFAQSSIDHRGTPEAPGRVVTVIDAREWHHLEGNDIPEGTILPEDFVWGVAYRIDQEHEEEVRAYMEHREKVTDNELRMAIRVTSCRCTRPAEIWIGKLDNPAFIGHEPIHELAKTISERRGPSGLNKDYLYKLADSVRHLYPHVRDDYLFQLEAAVKALDSRDWP
uniref:glutathione-specific gamma-glutamylcyclotransferase n=1 Tax=Kwoniella dejecticola CBS 10117 TaxID=1296121 RepID=A0A1A6A984_9TREE|nr:uncharacterized protein I303_02627 [Kwoniella dejecticola CBS 10117]OBR86618.1 hypothetical protein I303_02627 [Kwoniella dejecticola CBS 10117]